MKAEKKLLGQFQIHLSAFYTFQYTIWIYREKNATSVTVNLSTLSCFVQFVDMPVNKLVSQQPRAEINSLYELQGPLNTIPKWLRDSKNQLLSAECQSFFHGETINLLPYLTFVHFRAYWGMGVKGSYLHIYLKALRIL